ncbi:LysR family transcriptional regulator, partial [Cupriavidus pinatubonensis]
AMASAALDALVQALPTPAAPAGNPALPAAA